MTQKFEHFQRRKLIRDKYVTKKKEKLLGFSSLQRIKTHYQIFKKNKKRSIVKL